MRSRRGVNRSTGSCLRNAGPCTYARTPEPHKCIDLTHLLISLKDILNLMLEEIELGIPWETSKDVPQFVTVFAGFAWDLAKYIIFCMLSAKVSEGGLHSG